MVVDSVCSSELCFSFLFPIAVKFIPIIIIILLLLWFGMVWLGNFKKKTLNQYSFGGKRCSKLYLTLYIIIETLFGLVWYGLVWFGLASKSQHRDSKSIKFWRQKVFKIISYTKYHKCNSIWYGLVWFGLEILRKRL